MTQAICSRPFGKNGDLEKVLAFVQRVATQSARPELNMHLGDVAWRFNRSNQFQPTEAIQIWEHEQSDEIAGLGWYTAAHYGVDLLVANEYRGIGLEKRILTWAEQKLRQIPFEKRGHAEVKVQVFEWDKEREQSLSQAGYRRDMFHYTWFHYDLAVQLESPVLPAGFTIRPVNQQEAAARAELHNLAFFTDDVTQDSYLRVMNSAAYRPELDIVAVAPDGTLAAFALGWINPVLQSGLFEPVGTHPEFRRLGLAKAVILAGMRQMRAAGMCLALVYTESPNLQAQKLYLSAGFATAGKQFDWVKIAVQ